MNAERNCQACKYYIDGYCENLELQPHYPMVGCDDFENNDLDVLDKIRAEIEQNAYPIVHGVNNHELGMTLYGILQVIDKYRSESEE